MKWLKNIWKDPVASAVIATCIVTFFGAIAATVKGWWPSIGVGLVTAWRWMGQQSSFSNWLLLILWLALASVAMACIAFGIAFWRQHHAGPNDWRNYTRDHFLGVDWQWSYGTTAATIYPIAALCPKCKCQLTPNYGGYYSSRMDLYCEFCKQSRGDFEGDFRDLQQRIELLIQRNLRTGEWQDCQPKVKRA